MMFQDTKNDMGTLLINVQISLFKFIRVGQFIRDIRT